jgi:hypothetical protein
MTEAADSIGALCNDKNEAAHDQVATTETPKRLPQAHPIPGGRGRRRGPIADNSRPCRSPQNRGRDGRCAGPRGTSGESAGHPEEIWRQAFFADLALPRTGARWGGRKFLRLGELVIYSFNATAIAGMSRRRSPL